MIPVFVYGTLRTGCYNYERVLKGKVQEVEVASIEGYDMFNLGSYPGIISGKNKIVGELISINPALYMQTLQMLDRLEGYIPGQKSKSLYNREIQKVQLQDGSSVDAYVYVYNKKLGLNGCEEIPSGDWMIHNESKKSVF